MISFNPAAWYWLASDGRIYSSASDAVVAPDEAGYAAFLASGTKAAVWPVDETGAQTSAALRAVLQPYGLGGSLASAPSQAELAKDAGAKQIALRDGGITVNVGSTSTPDEVNVASNVDGRSLVTGCVQLIGVAQQAGQSPPTFPWINDDGTQLTLTSPQMMAIALALGKFVQATYATLGTVLAAIASGSITTTDQIAAAAWPATSY